MVKIAFSPFFFPWVVRPLRERETETEREIKQKIAITHGSNSVPLVPLHLELLNGDHSELFDILANKGIHAH